MPLFPNLGEKFQRKNIPVKNTIRPPVAQDPTKMYRYSFSGSDAKAWAYFEGMEDTIRPLEAMHTISVSVHEAKGQARALGYRGIKGIARGVRTIAGSIIFTVIEDNPLRPLMDNLRDFDARSDISWPGWSVDRHEIGVGTAFGGEINFSNRMAPLLPPTSILIQYQSEGALWSPRGDISTSSNVSTRNDLSSGDVTVSRERLGSGVPSFGREASIEGAGLLLRGVEFIDEGIVTSINDVVSEVTLSFIATDFKPMSAQVFDGGSPYLPVNDDQQAQWAMQQELFGNRADRRARERATALSWGP